MHGFECVSKQYNGFNGLRPEVSPLCQTDKVNIVYAPGYYISSGKCSLFISIAMNVLNWQKILFINWPSNFEPALGILRKAPFSSAFIRAFNFACVLSLWTFSKLQINFASVLANIYHYVKLVMSKPGSGRI